MANREFRLISNIIDKGNMIPCRKRSITPELFEGEEAKQAYEWLWKEFHDPRQPGTVPSYDRFTGRFPEFTWCPNRDSVDALISDLLDIQMENRLLKISAEVQAAVDDGIEPSLILQMYQSELKEIQSMDRESTGEALSASAAALKQDYKTMQEAEGVTGIPYPWAPMNRATGGMQDGQFLVIYGRPKNGKTWNALFQAAHAYLCGFRVYVFSKEMAPKQLKRRLATILLALSYEKVRQATLSPEEEADYFDGLEDMAKMEEEAAKDLGGHKPSIFIDSAKGFGKSSATVDTISARAGEWKADLVIVDGFYLMRDQRTNVRGRDWKQISNISSDLKEMAQHLKVPVIGTTQANRSANKSDGDDLAELGFSDAIGQDADLVMRTFLGREEGKSVQLLTFPGVRDAMLDPFLIRFNPGGEYDLLRSTVDVKAFVAGAQALQDKEAGKKGKTNKGKERGMKTPTRIR